MQRLRARFSVRSVMIAIALSVVFAQFVAKPLWKYYRLPPQTRWVLRKLNTRTNLPVSGTMPLEDLLKTVRSATQGPSDKGIPIYVDPVGLQEAEKTMTSQVNVSGGHQAIGTTLEEALGQLGLAYSVKDGMVTITSKEALDVPFE
jgi:hypothetical protein